MGAAGETFGISAPFAHRLDRGDDACALERAADPLHRPRIDSELFGNHTHNRALPAFSHAAAATIALARRAVPLPSHY